MRVLHSLPLVVFAALGLSACVTPFSQKAQYDFGVANARGTISLSDPKLYSREALINERAKDVAWIDRLIVESEDPTKISFRPEVIREVQEVTAFASALGLKFDPASALSYRQAAETGELQQQIDTLKLQLQLDQLKRDAELIRAKMTVQTDPVNTGLGSLQEPITPGTTLPKISTSAVDQLKGAIDKLAVNLESAASGDFRHPAPTTVTASPLDDFRDRSAYRDVLKSARNAASLDELHDSGNARLIRLNFQATVIPTEPFARSLGAVQLRVIAPLLPDTSSDYVMRWLRDINLDTRYRNNDGTFKSGTDIDDLVATRDFQLGKLNGVDLILPVLVDQYDTTQRPFEIIQRSDWQQDDGADSVRLGRLASQLSRVNGIPLAETTCLPVDSNDQSTFLRVLQYASDREQTIGFVRIANSVALRYEIPQPLLADPDRQLQRSQTLRSGLQIVGANRPDCERKIETLVEPKSPFKWRIFAGEGFLPGSDRVRIYEVGPREQVQEISTVARSANSLALAASLAASAPGSGQALDSAASYTRQSMGRASAMERVPSVVGYTSGGSGTFGWVIGPRAAIDPSGELEMMQYLKPYELSADLSVPGWWPSLKLQVVTSWAPSPEELSSGNLRSPRETPDQVIEVPLARDRSNFDAFTLYVLNSVGRAVQISDVTGGPASACAKSTLMITGRNVWRANKVYVLGQLLQADAITIMPDMSGVIVNLPAIPPIPGQSMDSTVWVMTPYGTHHSSRLTYLASPSGESCNPAKPAPAASTAPVIDTVTPDELIVPNIFTLTVTGKNLKSVDAADLYGQPGTVTQGDGTSLKIAFDEAHTGVIPTSNTVTLSLWSKKKQVASKIVRVRNKETN